MLLVLWERKRAEDGKLMTTREVHSALAEQLGPQAPSYSAVKDVVRGLQSGQESLLTHDKVPREHGEAGPSPTGYAISSGQIMTRPTTAVIVLRLFNYPSYEGVGIERFVKRISELNLIHEETGELMTREEIVDEIEYSKRLGYVTEDSDSHRLRVTDRPNAERLFLQEIADHAEYFENGERKQGNPKKKDDVMRLPEQRRSQSGSSEK